MKRTAWLLVALGFLMAAGWTGWRYQQDMASAQLRSTLGSQMAQTACGPIEYQTEGAGLPLLVIHGSGGGHDQGMAWAKPLAAQGVQVVAMSRFGYLRTPRPDDASPEAQADAHVCLLDALGLTRVAVMGVSAGAPSAMQTAIRHPARVSALALVVPIAHKPGDLAHSAPPVSDDEDALLLRLLGSDLLFWAGLQFARDPVYRHVLATPPELIAAASPAEQARVDDIARRILPVSRRAAGLHDDTGLGKRLRPYSLTAIQVPTLVVSARDDGFGTYASAEYTARQIPGATFLGFDQGGHLLVGHDAAVQAAILSLVDAAP